MTNILTQCSDWKVPARLNGYLVIRAEEHNNCTTVMVRQDPHRVVVATWYPELKDTWMWGHYVSNDEANETFVEVSTCNAKR